MNFVSVNAYAKINLFLEVCSRRDDGYHNIDSIMQSVSLCDIVTIEKNDLISLSNSSSLPNDKSNLAYKAAKAFFEYTGLKSGAKIHIEKHIPISAGLAGGSADAAAVLRGLNELYCTNIDIDTLCEIGSKLGADVPFCIKCGTYITSGIGDVFTECNSLPDCYIVISKTGEGISTPYAYGEIDNLMKDGAHSVRSSTLLASALSCGNIFECTDYMYNVFEKVVCPIRPMVQKQKDILNKHSSLFSMMSGSGPSVFGIFDKKENAENALMELKKIGTDAHLCKPYNP